MDCKHNFRQLDALTYAKDGTLEQVLGGMVVSGKQEGKKYLWGLLAGILYYVILVAVSMILNREAFTRIPGVFPALFLCAFGGMLGGMTQAGRK